MQRDDHRERLSNSQPQITRKPPAIQRNIPNRAVSLRQAGMVGDGTADRETTEGANREGHQGLAGSRILGGKRSNRKARRGKTGRLDQRPTVRKPG